MQDTFPVPVRVGPNMKGQRPGYSGDITQAHEVIDALINLLGTWLAQLDYRECFNLRHEIEGLEAQE